MVVSVSNSNKEMHKRSLMSVTSIKIHVSNNYNFYLHCIEFVIQFKPIWDYETNECTLRIRLKLYYRLIGPTSFVYLNGISVFPKNELQSKSQDRSNNANKVEQESARKII
jgi:hypothetical protein